MKKIIILGPESTGKSTLCEQLAEHHKTVWCPEFAREYLLMKGKAYNYEDLLNIAHGQIELEDTMLTEARNGFYFVDTDMYVMKVWCEVAFESCHTWILQQIARRKYDLYLLCCTDLPWQPDELREYPELESRKKLYAIYKDIMINQNTPWIEIHGSYEQRLKQAIACVEAL